MYLPLLVLATSLLVVGIVRYQHKKLGEKELLVQHILTALSKKFSTANVIVEGYAPGALVRKMRVENGETIMAYTWPIGENILKLPRVLSGEMAETVEFNGNMFSFLHFSLAHEKENASPEREGLGYQITLKREEGHPLCVEGIIGRKTLATSTHLSSFDRVIDQVSGV
ncbi:MAG: hypothetical protein AAB869_00915 [Patescibacteria group bacterium]